jgi:NAD(P)H dehydrogenase (quinone)
MNVTVINSHPWDGSFNHAILKTVTESLAKNKHKCSLIDLNKDHFDPVFKSKELALFGKGKYLDPKVGKYQKLIENSEHLIFIFPIWWGDLPAILRGFFDKVFLKNWAYVQAKSGLLKGKLKNIKSSTLIMTMGSPKIYYYLSVKASVKKNIATRILKMCGIKKTDLIAFCSIENKDNSDRKKGLEKIKNYIRNLK